MSSDPNHNTPMITRDNYEEYFLLYVDDELTPAAKKAVDNFVLLHPDLKEELDVLCSTKLPADAISFQNKEELLAPTMNMATVDESLLLYLDNELPAKEKERVEAQLQQDATFALQHQLLLKAKLDKNEHIPYPDKKRLYRRTEKRIAPYWLRIAAAVAVITGGTAVWMYMDRSEHSGSEVAIVTQKNTIPQTIPDSPRITNALASTENTVAAAGEKRASVEKEKRAVQPAVTAIKQLKKEAKKSTFSKPHIAADDITQPDIRIAKKAIAGNLETAVAKTDLPDVNKTVVTSETAPPFVDIDAAAKNTVPVYAAATETNDKSGSMKGFLRKATRFIERRTGIKTVNENDELLVGAVALKL